MSYWNMLGKKKQQMKQMHESKKPDIFERLNYNVVPYKNDVHSQGLSAS